MNMRRPCNFEIALGSAGGDMSMSSTTENHMRVGRLADMSKQASRWQTLRFSSINDACTIHQ